MSDEGAGAQPDERAGPGSRDRANEYAEAVLDLVARIPPGRAMTYGLVAEVLAEDLHRGGPRQVGHVMARRGGGVPWWRVVNAAGSPPAPYLHEALDALRAEGTPLSADGLRVVLRRAVWWPGVDGQM